jgi:16S rRNA (cytidine1402-2'-O)-methyltransferase
MISLPNFIPPIQSGLHIVATPIGNLGDITLRALAVLQQVDQIFCEDTRVSRKLLTAYGINTPLFPYHDHNAEQLRPEILTKLQSGMKLALISDAGTPLISDPGYKLVRACYEAQLPVTIIPGPSAVIAGLVLSGMPSHHFYFAGFAQPKRFPELREVDATLIFYEAPQRLVDCLEQMQTILPNRAVAVVREITKVYEEVVRGSYDEVIQAFRGQERCRGEIVIVLSPPEALDVQDHDIDTLLKQALQHHSLKDAVTLVAGTLGIARKQVYHHALALRADDHV